MMDRRIGLAALDVEKYSKIGTQDLQNNQLDQALEAFKYAYKRSHELDDGYTERACAFNLGAAYIAMGQPKRGLEILQKAVPPENKKEGKSNGDLYFNFGLGYEGLGNYEDAARNYSKALDDYKTEGDNLEMEAETLEKLARIYSQTKNAFAADTYGQLVLVYEHANNPANYMKHMKALFEKASHLHLSGKKGEAESAADDCMALAEKCGSNNDVGNILNDLGLVYTQLQKYDRALTCFEQALPMIRTKQVDKKQEAVILQNLGATYNFLGDYQRAIGFHENAAKLYAELKNRNSQGQCFANLAFAFSQLKDSESAGEAFLHAYQASKDTGDKRTQWQVTEGLGAVAFNRGQINKAIQHFKQALSILATCDPNAIAQDRIVGKLTHALQVQVTAHTGKHHMTHTGKHHSQHGIKNVEYHSTHQITEEKPMVKKQSHGKAIVAEHREEVASGQPVIKYGKGERFIPVARRGSSRRFRKVARGISTPSLPGSASNTLRKSTLISTSESSSETSESTEQSEESEESDLENAKQEYSRKVKMEQEQHIGLENRESPSARRNLEKELIQEESEESDESGSSEEGEEDEEEPEGEVKEKHENEEDEEKADVEAVKEHMRKITAASEGESSDEEMEDDDEEEEEEEEQEETQLKRPLSPKVKVEPATMKSSDSDSESDTDSPPVPTKSPMPTSALVRTYDYPEPTAKEAVQVAKDRRTQYADIDFETPLGKSEHYDDGEPVYQTIKSENRTLNDQPDTPSFEQGPDFSNFDDLPRGEKAPRAEEERRLFEEHQKFRKKQADAPPLPERNTEQKQSRTCIVM